MCEDESPSEKIINAWREERLRYFTAENERLQKQIHNTKKTEKIKEPKRLSKKQCDRLVKKYRPKKMKRNGGGKTMNREIDELAHELVFTHRCGTTDAVAEYLYNKGYRKPNMLQRKSLQILRNYFPQI